MSKACFDFIRSEGKLVFTIRYDIFNMPETIEPVQIKVGQDAPRWLLAKLFRAVFVTIEKHEGIEVYVQGEFLPILGDFWTLLERKLDDAKLLTR